MKICTVEEILDIKSHPNADKLDLLTIQGYESISAKDSGFIKGQKVLFVHPDSVVPHENKHFSFMEKCKWRVRPIRLRGIFSNGLVCNPKDFPEVNMELFEIGDEVGDLIGATHYEKPLPSESGNGFKRGLTAGNYPSFLRKTDETNLRSSTGMLGQFRDTLTASPLQAKSNETSVIATLKIDGTSAAFAKTIDGVFSVSSRNLEIKPPENGAKSVYWEMATKYDIEKHLKCGQAIQGEIYGKGIQRNPLKIPSVDFIAFSLFDIASHNYMSMKELFDFTSITGIPHVKIVKEWTETEFSTETIQSLMVVANSVKYVDDEAGEGIVIRHLLCSEENFIKNYDYKANGAVRVCYSTKLINENYKD